jgi:hypothetical protein
LKISRGDAVARFSPHLQRESKEVDDAGSI